jgi:hypothetical protein
MDVAQPFFHHRNIDVSCSSIRVRRATRQVQKIEGTIHIPDIYKSEHNVVGTLKYTTPSDPYYSSLVWMYLDTF